MTINTGDYCWVDAGAVDQGPQKLPQNWTDPNTGQQFSNLNNTIVWPDAQLLIIGWYPYILVDAGAPGGSPYYRRSLGSFQVQATEVVQTAIYTQFDIEEVRSIKNDELDRGRRFFTLLDKAINSSVEQYIQDDAQWLSDRQVELVQLTDWNDVANFDTVRPLVTLFSNNYIGIRYVEEGLKLTAENRTRIDSGQAPKWDQTIVDSFISANQLAADDVSGSQAPAEPVYQIRQGVGKVNEQYARVVVWRESREDPNPALRTTYKMKLFDRNPSDLRNLYVFSYTNGTYLTWRLFEDLGDNVWGLEATPAEWQYVPADMAFIFSYGTNPAVEADFFTDRVEFPAGVQSRNIFVAWDPV